jgi:signal transduction histidine kinase
MARDFNQIAQTDLFEVLDRQGRVLASVGGASSSRDSRADLVRKTLGGSPVEGVLVEKGAHYQVALAPVQADGHTVGVLLLGRQIGQGLAHELRGEMHCEVTFLSGRTITGTTLEAPGDRAALVHALERIAPDSSRDPAGRPVEHVHAPHADYLTVVRRLPGSDPSTRQLYVMQRSFDPETAFLGLMRRDMMVLAAIAVLAALVTGLLFSEQVLRPVQRLVRAAQAMEKGDYDCPLDVRRSDELGYLTTRFSEMRRRERAYLGSLEQSTRLKSRFLSVASHELRTPISVLIGYHDLFVNGGLGPLTPTQSQALETMRTHLARLTRLAEDAARFARVKGERLVLDLQSHDVPALLGRAVTAARAAGAGRTLDVAIRCDSISGPVDADVEGLEQSIAQVVMNAIRFTPDTGHVEVVARELDGRLRIEVTDNGVGIAGERLEAVLTEGFAPGDPLNHRSAVGLEFNVPGLGLGLAITKAIIEAHGGTLSATSRLGSGSTFVIELPMHHDAAAREAA